MRWSGGDGYRRKGKGWGPQPLSQNLKKIYAAVMQFCAKFSLDYEMHPVNGGGVRGGGRPTSP